MDSSELKRSATTNETNAPASGKAPGKEGLIVAAAKAIGSVAGTVAHSIGIRDQTTPPAKTTGKLQPKKKARLPRRLKKALQKKAMRKKSTDSKAA